MSVSDTYTTGSFEQIATAGDRNFAAWFANETLKYSQLVQSINTQEASHPGAQHKFRRLVSSTAAADREYGAGFTPGKDTWENITLQLKICGKLYSEDAKAVEDTNNPDRELSIMAFNAIRKTTNWIGSKILNGDLPAGTSTQLGLRDYVDDDMIVDAGGDGGAPVYIICSHETECSLILPKGGAFTVSGADEDTAWEKYPIKQDDGSILFVYIPRAETSTALQVGSKYSIAQITGLDGTEGHTLTDSLLLEAFSKFPSDYKNSQVPNMMIMNGVHQLELTKSRVSKNVTTERERFENVWTGGNYPIPMVIDDQIYAEPAEASV